MATGKRATCSWAELQSTSDNYHGEILGAIGFLSVIRAVLTRPSIKAQLGGDDRDTTLRAWTDYKGVILHWNDPNKKLKQGQAHPDLICVI